MATKNSAKRGRTESDDLPYLSHGDSKLIFHKSTFTIGRDTSNDYVITEVEISRFHCTFKFNKSEQVWYITDTSSGGTLVNKKKLKKDVAQPIKAGDEISVSDSYIFLFHQPKLKKLPVKRRKSDEIDESCNDKADKENNVPSGGMEKFCKDFEDEMTCAICNEFYVKATALSCSHIFCKTCINRWKQTKKICPVCRANIASEIQLLSVDNVINSYFTTTSAENSQAREKLVKERTELEKTLQPKKKRARVTAPTTRGRRRRPARAPMPATTGGFSNNSVIVVDDTDTSVISSDDDVLARELDEIYAAMELRFPSSFLL